MSTTSTDPFYKRLSLNLISLTLLAALLYLAQNILVPLFFSILIATLLLPVVHLLERKLPKVMATLLTIAVAFLLITGVVYFLSHQILLFLKDSDTIKERFNELLASLQGWIDETLHINNSRQREYISQTTQNIKDSGMGIVGSAFGTLSEMLSYVIFLPVYSFLILYYRSLIKKFLIAVFKGGESRKVEEILFESKSIGQGYVTGLGIEMAVVFTLNSIGFLILGIKYAIFLALVAALLNLVPYIGMLTANVFSILITLISSQDISDVIWVAVILAVVQIIDNNFLMPVIVGNKVRINALVTILGVVIGGALCGVSGMFLAIPAMAVLKVIFDRVEELKPWGMLLGDDASTEDPEKVTNDETPAE